MRRREKEITDQKEIESVIFRSDVCRIAFAGEVPYIVTLNFGYEGGQVRKLYFHCANQGRKLDLIKKNNYVCFEMDTDHVLIAGNPACECSISYSSIVGYGHISVVSDVAEKKLGLDSIMNHYSPGKNYDYNKSSFERTVVLRLDISELTAKRG